MPSYRLKGLDSKLGLCGLKAHARLPPQVTREEKVVLCVCSELWMWKTGRKMDLQTRSGPKGWFTGEGSLSYSYKSLVATGGIPNPWKMPLVPVGSHRKEEPGLRPPDLTKPCWSGEGPAEGAVQTWWAHVLP